MCRALVRDTAQCLPAQCKPARRRRVNGACWCVLTSLNQAAFDAAAADAGGGYGRRGPHAKRSCRWMRWVGVSSWATRVPTGAARYGDRHGIRIAVALRCEKDCRCWRETVVPACGCAAAAGSSLMIFFVFARRAPPPRAGGRRVPASAELAQLPRNLRTIPGRATTPGARGRGRRR